MFGLNNKKVNTDPDKVEQLLTRGVENIFPSKDFLRSKLTKGEEISVYLGIDPTGPTLHLGHVIPLLKLRQFQDLGHKIILLIGDFTAMIGDPTDKTAVRKQLTIDEVANNLKEYKKQASKIISFSGSNPAAFKFNSAWFEKMGFKDVLKLTSLMTVDQMLAREMFDRRSREGKPIYIHEFIYPLMQGYDSVALDVDGEVGGNDQTFNMLVGRDLVKEMLGREKFVLATKLMVGSNGIKMGKTEGNMVSLDQSPSEMFGRVMSWSDDLIIPAFELVTQINQEEIEKVKNDLASGINPKELKLRLSREIVKLCHSEEEANRSEKVFEETFSKGEFPSDAPVVEAGSQEKLADVLTENGLVESKSEFRRLVEAGAVSDYPNLKVADPNEIVGNKERRMKIGKKTFVVLKPK